MGATIFPRGGDHHNVAAAELVIGDQIGGLGEHQGVDDVVQCLGHDRLHLFHIPARAHVGDVCAHPIHLVVVGAGQQEEELCIARFQDRASVDQALIEERLAEGEGARLGDHGLV